MIRTQFVTALPLLAVLLILNGCAGGPEPVGEETAPPTQPALRMPLVPTPPALAPGASRVNGIAAVVNDEIITFREVLREAEPLLREARKKGPLDDKVRRELRATVLERLIEKRLTEQKARELGIKIGDDEVRQAIDDVKRQNNNMTQSQLEAALQAQGFSVTQYEAQVREQLERLRLISVEVRAKVHVSDREAEAYYEANRQKYAEEERFRARHIFIKVDEKAPETEVRQAMTKALNLLHDARSGKDFAELARQFSEDPAAKKDGGDLGYFKRGDMLADLEQALLPLKPGQVGELVITPSGLHIVKLEERSSVAFKPFESVKAEIVEQLYRTKQEERFAQWMKELRSQASVELRDGNGIL
ncbi:peptidylprolyl isomerase [Trichlorobacter ammonificans]|uniref:Survival protein SurA (Peptidyl-prolyl cis-trans isomerase SurA) n=1 Tax=Trichlorobacter ammonificans TaxID=2916410 RepID=A0ABN8HFK2_9BACT|nr:peptidylprolyl isomerase [Trichlorobacter ammonificans]CAH2030205.1 Survival protein SurA precursor (Peptidyl-prolyl cis-trans isomerase SurA) [Trichlorobacter ammonificans]